MPWRWPNFTPKEMACPCCGEEYIDENSMDALQKLRDIVGPLKINSAHRCGVHNARVGGAPLSEHLQLAFDISVGQIYRPKLYFQAQLVGFNGFGFGQTFLHVDMRKRPAFWYYGPLSAKAWGTDGKVRP